MSFAVAAEAYDRFMGVYARELAPQLADLAGVAGVRRVLDVGCGPGALTAELVRRVGPEHVAAVDPSAPFVEAVRERLPAVDVRQASAEALPFPDRSFDAALAQLVVHFMADPVAGLGELRRVTRLGGVVATCVWDMAGGRAPHSAYWRAAHAVDPDTRDESQLPGARGGHLAELLGEAGLREIVETTLFARVEHASFEAWWEPYTLGVGPAGAHARSLDARRLAEVREHCREELGEGPFTVGAYAWAARGTVPAQA